MSCSSADLSPNEAPAYRLLRQEAEVHANAGRLHEALAICRQGLTWAEHQGITRYQDQAFCGRAAVLIALGEGERVVGRLRRILMRNSHPIPQVLAAHSLSLFHDRRGEATKAISYAARALHQARDCHHDRHIVRCLNRLANARCLDSDFLRASRLFQEGLERIEANEASSSADPLSGLTRGILMANLGSSLIMIGRAREGLGQLASAHQYLLRQPATLRSNELTRRVHLGLSFGYLHLERPLIAGQYAKEALNESEAPAPSEIRKKALFLLGEANKFAGNEAQARIWFSGLQDEFYPEMPDVVDLLMHTDTRDLVNPWN